MAVTAKFVPDHLDLVPGVPVTSTVRLYNGDDVARDVTLSATTDSTERLRLDMSTARLEPKQIVDVTATVEVPTSMEPGTCEIGVVVTPASDDEGVDTPVVTASATALVTAHGGYTAALQPAHSRGSSRGRHVVRVVNTGNVLVTVDLSAEHDDAIGLELEPSALTVAPGSTAEAAVRAIASTTYWNGPTTDHAFVVSATSSDGRTDDLAGVYRQRPRLPNWVGPAAAGALAALVLGAIAWFALLRPWVQDTADRAAADAIELDRAALRDRIAELEVAAAEAEELPLGTPTDVRLEVAPTGGNTEEATDGTPAGTRLSITDVVFQNPTGAVGTVTLRRGDETILQSELANFRDFDLHFVAPFVFDDDVEIVLEVECRTPGAGASDCPIGASLVGFVDEVD